MNQLTQAQLKSIAVDCCGRLLAAREGIELFNEPFRHVVIDNFFPDDFAKACLDAFPGIDAPVWEQANDPDIEVKFRTAWKSEFDIPDGILPAVRILNSAPFVLAMSQVMGIKKIIPDPYFTGGGLNVTMRGGLLDVHVDGNYHDATGLNRRLNALVYLNPNWQEEWGGEFGVYDAEGEVCLKKVAPLYNRLVIFDSHDKSFHGLPDPVNFPEDEPRRSIILYYYTVEARPASQIVVDEPHSALWKKRNLLDKRGSKTRNFT
ncbi:MAG: 2OG-Fe(II) oxygenase [Thiomonas arsenitoxydans]|uniref:2OG-Fe(II) oxygenase n=1 Tax=Thiomonas arsenitoxydans (strain DSM 22701 / CIP 110005 / 3As) TaxID=426114 RepID=A0A8I1MRY5_THIA3|nr:2OG-Fe(II) oxygenase [Thiomonas arsenitoxydans]MBN8742710.1 2OG-Fe(II) oxygenase [Thiomonas arsenitoxydans]